jgi:hypothetical protein
MLESGSDDRLCQTANIEQVAVGGVLTDSEIDVLVVFAVLPHYLQLRLGWQTEFWQNTTHKKYFFCKTRLSRDSRDCKMSFDFTLCLDNKDNGWLYFYHGRKNRSNRSHLSVMEDRMIWANQIHCFTTDRDTFFSALCSIPKVNSIDCCHTRDNNGNRMFYVSHLT